MDGVVIDYGSSKDKKKGSMMATRSEVAELDELQSEWEKKHRGRSSVGKKMDLSEFMRGG